MDVPAAHRAMRGHPRAHLARRLLLLALPPRCHLLAMLRGDPTVVRACIDALRRVARPRVSLARLGLLAVHRCGAAVSRRRIRRPMRRRARGAARRAARPSPRASGAAALRRAAALPLEGCQWEMRGRRRLHGPAAAATMEATQAPAGSALADRQQALVPKAGVMRRTKEVTKVATKRKRIGVQQTDRAAKKKTRKKNFLKKKNKRRCSSAERRFWQVETVRALGSLRRCSEVNSAARDRGRGERLRGRWWCARTSDTLRRRAEGQARRPRCAAARRASGRLRGCDRRGARRLCVPLN